RRTAAAKLARQTRAKGTGNMAKTRVGINGFGRIGRNFFRAYLQHGGDFEIVAANDLGDVRTMAHLLKHDSVLGTLAEPVDAPEQHALLSDASCATNCVAPLAEILREAYTIERGFMTTIHAYTNDQRTLDLPHEELRRARAAAINLIPTSTGAARAIGVVLPELQGKVDGISVRAPVPTGSVTDLVVQLGAAVTVEEVNAAYREAAGSEPLQDYLQYSEDPLVSTDIQKSQYSCIFDSMLTMANGTTAKVFGWYDNEWGYSCRLVDLVAMIGETLPVEAAAAAA